MPKIPLRQVFFMVFLLGLFLNSIGRAQSIQPVLVTSITLKRLDFATPVLFKSQVNLEVCRNIPPVKGKDFFFVLQAVRYSDPNNPVTISNKIQIPNDQNCVNSVTHFLFPWQQMRNKGFLEGNYQIIAVYTAENKKSDVINLVIVQSNIFTNPQIILNPSSIALLLSLLIFLSVVLFANSLECFTQS